MTERTRELSALYETARKAISAPDLDALLPMLLTPAADLLNCHASSLHLVDPETGTLRLTADHNLSEAFQKRSEVSSGAEPVGAVLREGRPVAVDDLTTDDRFPNRELALREGIRSSLSVPLRDREETIGVLTVYGGEPRRYTPEEVAALSEFATLASIALQKVRLHGETIKAKEHLNAILEINKQIGAATGIADLLQAIADEAAQLLRVDGVGFRLVEGDSLVPAAATGAARYVMLRPRLKIGESLTGQAAAAKRPLIFTDIQHHPAFAEEHRARAIQHGITGMLAVPVHLGERIIGVLNLYAGPDRPFTARDVETATAFADQAGIAIERARLLQESEARAARLKALIEVGKAISAALDLETVLQTIVVAATQVIQADSGIVMLPDDTGEKLLWKAHVGWPEEYWRIGWSDGRASLSARVFRSGKPLAVADRTTDPTTPRLELARRHGIISYLGVPIRSGEAVIGVIALSTRQPRQFTEAEIALLSTFADQAAIAIANVQHYAEVARRQREAEVVAELARNLNASLDLDTVLQRFAEGARELCGGDLAQIALREPGAESIPFRCSTGPSGQPDDTVQIERGKGIGGQVLLTGRPFRTDNYAEDPRFSKDYLVVAKAEGIVAEIAVPIRIGERVEGVVFVYNRTPRPFTDRDEAMLLRLADQAAVAIQNARLYAQAERRRRAAESLAGLGRLVSQSLDRTEIAQQVARSVMALLGVRNAALFRLEPTSGDLLALALAGELVASDAPPLSLPRGAGASGRAVLERRPVLTADLFNDPDMVLTPEQQARFARAEFRAVLAVPLIVKEQVIGALAVGDRPGRVFTPEEIQLVQTFADHAALAFGNADLYEETVRRQREAEIIAELTRDISASLDLDTMLQRLANWAQELCQADLTEIALRHPETGAMRIRHWAGASFSATEGRLFEPGKGVGGQVMLTGRPFRTDNYAADPRISKDYLPTIQAHGVIAELMVPIRIGERLEGLLCVDRCTPRPFTDRDETILMRLADQAAIAITNAQQYEEITRRRREAEIIAELTRDISASLDLDAILQRVGDGAKELCYADVAEIEIFDPGAGCMWVRYWAGVYYRAEEAIRIEPGKGIGGLIMLTGRPFRTDHYAEDPRITKDYVPLVEARGLVTAAAVPIRVGGQVEGVLFVYNRTPRPFTDRDETVLLRLADQAGIAIDNARLYEEARRQAERLAALTELGRLVSQSLDPEDVAHQVVTSVTGLLNALNATLFRLEPESGDPVPMALSGDGEPTPGRSPVSPPGTEVSRLAVLERKPAVTADLLSDPRVSLAPEHRARLAQAPSRAVLAVPLIVKNRVIGALAVGDRLGRVFSAEEIRLTQTFADQAAVALENAWLHQETERAYEAAHDQARELAALHEVGTTLTSTLDASALLETISENAMRLLDAQGSAVFELDPRDHWLYARAVRIVGPTHPMPPLKLGQGAAGGAALRREPVFSPDVRAHPLPGYDEELLGTGKPLGEVVLTRPYRAILAVPLIAKERALGAIVVYWNQVHPSDERDVRLLTALSQPAAVALENARLHEETVRRNQELAALHDLTSAMAQTLDLDTRLQTALEKVQEVTGKPVLLIRTLAQEANLLVLRAHRGLPPAYLQAIQTFPAGTGISGSVVQEKQPIYIPDTAQDPRLELWGRFMEGAWSYLCVPLLAKGQAIGTLHLASPRLDDFSPEQQRLIVAMASSIAMAVENANLYQELRDYSATLEERVRERTQELEIANQHKSEFLATMSHELRTPLNAVIGFSELLQTQLGGTLSDRHRRYINNIHVSGHHLLDLINGILDLAKVESGKMDLHWEEVPLPELLQQVLAGLQPQAEAKALTFATAVEAGLDRVTLDAGKAKQILYNLVGNAVKFTPDGGRVQVAARVLPRAPRPRPEKPSPVRPSFLADGEAAPDRLEFAVSDTGIGIKPEHLGRIFEPFQQIDSSLGRKYPGTGLGLALTKKLVELHGGQIRVESTPGQGSTFTFTLALPAPVLLRPSQDAREVEPLEGEEAEVAGTPGQPLILVVEDDVKAIDLLSHYLQVGGYRVAVGRSHAETVRKARALRPLAVTLDILFPTEDGWQILQDLKRDPATRNIPVLIISIVDDRPRGLQMGAVEYLVKPVTQEALFAGLARLGLPLPRLRGMRVLAIDDDPATLDLLQITLNHQGLTLYTARDGPEGLRLAAAQRPDLILLDLMMPGMTGFEVVERLRAEPATAAIPIFIYSAKTLSQTERELLAQRVQQVLQKGSYRPSELLAVLATLRGQPQPPA